MDIITYRQKTGLSQSEFATLLTDHGFYATQGLVSHWETGRRTPTAEWAMRMEAVTKGKLKKSQLRPDLWGRKKKA